jgi:hypothetical protein
MVVIVTSDGEGATVCSQTVLLLSSLFALAVPCILVRIEISIDSKSSKVLVWLSVGSLNWHVSEVFDVVHFVFCCEIL